MIKSDFEPNYVFEEINSLTKKLEIGGVRKFKYDFKTRLHTFFSLTNEFVGMKIGEASKAGAFDWDSTRLDYLKKFIKEILDK